MTWMPSRLSGGGGEAEEPVLQGVLHRVHVVVSALHQIYKSAKLPDSSLSAKYYRISQVKCRANHAGRAQLPSRSRRARRSPLREQRRAARRRRSSPGETASLPSPRRSRLPLGALPAPHTRLSVGAGARKAPPNPKRRQPDAQQEGIRIGAFLLLLLGAPRISPALIGVISDELHSQNPVPRPGVPDGGETGGRITGESQMDVDEREEKKYSLKNGRVPRSSSPISPRCSRASAFQKRSSILLTGLHSA